jgi:hypothetical protein
LQLGFFVVFTARKPTALHSPDGDHKRRMSLTGSLLESTDLVTLLAPHSVETFLSTIWERKPCHFARSAGNISDGLLRLDQVDELLWRAAQLGPVHLRLVRCDEGRVTDISLRRPRGSVDMKEVQRAHDDGFTVIINRVDRFWRPVAGWVRSLENALRFPMGVNVYLTPPRAQGFSVHHDTHDVFILQAHGRKSWRLYEPVVALATADQSNEPRPHYGKPHCRVTLEPGDRLYMPRGVPHDAITDDETSLHLTLGVHVTIWRDLLLSVVRQAALRDVTLREAIPLGVLGHTDGVPELASSVARLVERLQGDLLFEAAAERLSFDFINALAGRGYTDFVPRREQRDINIETQVNRSCEQVCFVSRRGARVSIHFPGGHVEGPSGIEPALRYIAERRSFVIGEIPGELTSASRLVLARRLLREGLLTLAGSSQETQLTKQL